MASGISSDCLVLGGGIAGLSTAWALARRGAAKVTLVEQEPLVGSHSSGRNAAIWLPVEDDLATRTFAPQSVELLDELFGDLTWKAETGAVLAAPSKSQLFAAERSLTAQAAPFDVLSESELFYQAPQLRGGRCGQGLLVHQAGVMDIAKMIDTLHRAARRLGVRILCGEQVGAFLGNRIRVDGVRTTQGRSLRADRVIIASGAWAGVHGEMAGVPTPHIPLRRHLMQLKSEHRNQRPSRVIWTLSPEMYFRSESSGILACAGEEDEMMPSIPTKDPAVFSVLTDKLKKMAPLLLETKVQRYWACVRTFTADRQPLLGIDPRKEGLAWASGFGGRGMTIGLAAGDHVARSVLQSEAVGSTFCPGRITGKPDRLAG